MRPLSLAAELFPPSVAVVALQLEPAHEAQLAAFADLGLPERLQTAILKRRVEFLAGRHCARAALRVYQPQHAERPIEIGESREPLWPDGVVGAISHTHGYAAAAVAERRALRGVGLDIERWVKPTAPATIGSHVARRGELEALTERAGWSAPEALTLLFSAKESIYKCLFPEVRRYFGFHDATIESIESHADGHGGTFRARLETTLTDALSAGFLLHGRFERRDDVIITALVLEH